MAPASRTIVAMAVTGRINADIVTHQETGRAEVSHNNTHPAI